ncbi:hypothetical protein ARMSODRAFT_974603 [Armillaria solidipes]|uniref:Uncharacterized protein n=1 Tax=Armillaria solidipes TaxID=1076256 RepID=A0A2H3C1V9_9AGAR|nr:hypothetical protein ARMSODRAFT_974603 [Armillaria solidipes]
MGHEDGKKTDPDTIVYEWPSCLGSFVRRRRKEERRGNVGRQRRKSPWWKAAIETGNSFVVAKADTSAMASTYLPQYDDGAHQPKDTTGIAMIRPKENPMTPQSTCCAQEHPPALPRKVVAYLLRINGIIGLRGWIACNETETFGGDLAVHEALDASPGHRIYRTPDANPALQPLGIATNEMIVPAFAGIGRVKRRDS